MEMKMRRPGQMLPPEESFEILRNMTHGVLALQGDEDYPYSVPVSYACDGEHIYIHSAQVGHKICCLHHNPKVSFCVVAQDQIVPEEFTTYFRSVIVFGTARFITAKPEMEHGLKLLADKYSPGIDSCAEITGAIGRVAVIRISIDAVSGKEAVELAHKRKRE